MPHRRMHILGTTYLLIANLADQKNNLLTE